MYILLTKAKFNCLLFVEIDQHAVTKFLTCIWGEFFPKPNVTISSFQRTEVLTMAIKDGKNKHF